MSNAIHFLETLGSKPTLSPADYAATVAALNVDAAQQQALLCRDPEVLNGLLGGRLLMAMHIVTPDGGEEPQENPDHTGDEDGEETEDAPEPTEKPN